MCSFVPSLFLVIAHVWTFIIFLVQLIYALVLSDTYVAQWLIMWTDSTVLCIWIRSTCRTAHMLHAVQYLGRNLLKGVSGAGGRGSVSDRLTDITMISVCGIRCSKGAKPFRLVRTTRCVNRWDICVTVHCAQKDRSSDGPERRPLEGAERGTSGHAAAH